MHRRKIINITSMHRGFPQSSSIVRHFFSGSPKFESEEMKWSINDDTGIATIQLQRHGARNALGKNLLSQFQHTLTQLTHLPAQDVRVVIIESLVPRVFCAGADLKERSKMSPTEAAETVMNLRQTFMMLSNLPVPTIAVIEGAALGGGLELALACDFRIASESASLGCPETALAIIPGAGGTQRLPRLIGQSRAKELVFTAKRLSASESLDIGLVNHVTSTGQAFERAQTLAHEIIPNGPLGVRLAKEAIDRGMEVDITTGLAIERACYAQVLSTQDRLEGLRAFQEKRAPEYHGA